MLKGECWVGPLRDRLEEGRRELGFGPSGRAFGKYDPLACSGILECDEGGCVKAFGCGVKQFWSFLVDATPNAVAFSSPESSLSSSSPVASEGAEESFRLSGEGAKAGAPSFEDVMTLSESLSLSSYSSWLLPSALTERPMRLGRCCVAAESSPFRLLLLDILIGWEDVPSRLDWTFKPCVTTSSGTDEADEAEC